METHCLENGDSTLLTVDADDWVLEDQVLLKKPSIHFHGRVTHRKSVFFLSFYCFFGGEGRAMFGWRIKEQHHACLGVDTHCLQQRLLRWFLKAKASSRRPEKPSK